MEARLVESVAPNDFQNLQPQQNASSPAQCRARKRGQFSRRARVTVIKVWRPHREDDDDAPVANSNCSNAQGWIEKRLRGERSQGCAGQRNVSRCRHDRAVEKISREQFYGAYASRVLWPPIKDRIV